MAQTWTQGGLGASCHCHEHPYREVSAAAEGTGGEGGGMLGSWVRDAPPTLVSFQFG